MVRAIARRVVRSARLEDLDDAQQTILLRVVTKLDKWDGRCPFCKWLAVVAARGAIDFSRRIVSHEPLPRELPDPALAKPPIGVAECIERKLETLPPEWRRAFELASRGVPREEIAHAVGKSERTIHYWLAAIRDQLQECIDS